MPNPQTDAPLWRPDPARIAGLPLTAFTAEAERRTGRKFPDYAALHMWSVEDPGAFWELVWDFAGVIGDKGPGPYLVDDGMPGARFFPEARLNFAENLLRRNDDGEAIVFRGEDGATRRLTWAELQALVSRVQQMLANAGVGVGDRVAAYLPNIPEAIAALIATASLGAIWSSASPDFGVDGVVDRFGQIAPTVFIATDGYRYAGKEIDLADKVRAIVPRLGGSVRRIVVVPVIGRAGELVASLPEALTLDNALSPYAARPVTYVRLPFNQPLLILFSSGTTGVPKCIVHSAGGALLQLIKEHRLHSAIGEGDRVFYFTTLGWMMWNWLGVALASGATLMLFDGSPFHPGPEVLFDYAEKERFTFFGTSAKFIDAVKKADYRPADRHDLSALRTISSTGSPLAPESFDFVYDAIKRDVHLASISGGTDIVSCFVLGVPSLPVWRGEIQGAGLGMAMGVYDGDGKPMRLGKGELVCTRAFPSMPVGFWNDPDGARYRAAYFERFPGIWCHGDFAEWTEHGGIVIHGRSDATLNPGGVRIGTGEIYRQVEQVPEVIEALAVGQDFDGDVRVVLFVRLREGASLDEPLLKRIKTQIRTGASPRHVPAKVVAVADIPRTKSGKIVELAVREVVHGRPVKNIEALANPAALDLFRDLPELRE